MNEPRSIEALVVKFLEDRDGLSDDEFKQLLEALRSRPKIAEELKDHLMLEEQLAQHFTRHRQDFPARFEHQRQTEGSHAAVQANRKDEVVETYALSHPATADVGSNGSSAARRSPGKAEPKPPTVRADSEQASPSTGEPRHPWRKFFAVMLFLLLLAGGLLRLEYTAAARKIAEVSETDGMALIYRDGVGIVADIGMPILPGDEIRVQKDAHLTLMYRDQTQVRIRAGTTLVLQPAGGNWPGLLTASTEKEISISQGNLELDIAPQPAGRPMLLKTPQVKAQGLGARLVVAVEETQSRIEVLEGRFRVESLRNQEPAVELTAGQEVVATDAEFRVSPGAWPSDPTGLVFLLTPSATQSQPPNEGVRVHAEGINHSSVILRPRGNASLEAGRLVFRGGAFLAEEQTAAALLAACRRSNAISLEATFQTSDLSQTGPARWITFSTGSEAWNVSLVQEGRDCILRLLTDAGEKQHEVRLFEIPDRKPHQVVVTYSPGKLQCYFDGKPIPVESQIRGRFAGWTPQQLVFGDEWNGGKEWTGELTGIAIYDRVLSAEEVARNVLHFRLRYGDEIGKTAEED